MNDELGRDLEARLVRSLHAAAPVPPPGLAERLLATSAVVRQRGGWMSLPIMPALAAAAVIILAIVIGLQAGNLLPDGRGIGGPAPSTTAAPTPSASPVPSASAQPSAVPSATPSPSVALPEENECTNDELRFTVRYPADWWTNDRIEPTFESGDPIPACTYFAEEAVELSPNADVPATVAIGFRHESQVTPPSSGAITLSTEEVTVAERPAIVREDEEGASGAPFSYPGQRRYTYFVELPDGSYLVAGTSSRQDADPGEYERHTDVLDRMMQSLELLDG